MGAGVERCVGMRRGSIMEGCRRGIAEIKIM